MGKKHFWIILLVAVCFSMTSCARFYRKKHMEKAESLEKKGNILTANDEYIRTLKGTTDPVAKAELTDKIATNFRKANKLEESVEYYQESIQTSNSINQKNQQSSMNPPYDKLADSYIALGQPESAGALLTELDQVKPPGYQKTQIDISKKLALHYTSDRDFQKAEQHWRQLSAYAEKMGDKATSEAVKRQIEHMHKLHKSGKHKAAEKDEQEEIVRRPRRRGPVRDEDINPGMGEDLEE